VAKPPLPDKVVEKLKQPNPCTITTLRPDGTPVSVATWYLLDGDRVLVNMDHTRKRLQHLRDDPRVALTVLDKDSWYTHVSIVGRVVEIADDEDLRDIDRLSRHYNGKDYPVRDSARVSAWIEIERWHGWGATKRR
jgi:PPOX class probable F420-dependent enzyme